MSGTTPTKPMSIDEVLKAIQGRKGTKFDQACDQLWKAAEAVDEKNRPARELKRAAEKLAMQNAKPGESVSIDMTPEWRGVLRYYIEGVRSKRNEQSLIDKMLQTLRNLLIHGTESQAESEVAS